MMHANDGMRNDVTVVCARCESTLAPAFGGRLRCPRLAACGYGGIIEDGARARRQMLVRALARVRGTTEPIAAV